MSRKRKAPVRKVYPDPKFRSELVSKFINVLCMMEKDLQQKKFYMML